MRADISFVILRARAILLTQTVFNWGMLVLNLMFSILTRSPISNAVLNISWFKLASADFLVPFEDLFVYPLATLKEYSFCLRAQNSFICVFASSAMNFRTIFLISLS